MEIDEDTEVEIQEIEEVVDEPQIFTIVEQFPSLPGCENIRDEQKRKECTETEIMKFLGKNIKYPAMAKDAGISGIVYVNFEINQKGVVKDVKILRGIGGGCDEEAIRVVKKFPKFFPGKQRGKPVRVSYNLPIRFTLR
ncbi:MAG: hypothetical protein COA57_15125 [Flavobacteriales bacterium]|nr:MAG: hypothetical protein COA57_15125 [Flavobacteriales bacterium]